MSARYVIVEFDDPNAAENFVMKTLDRTEQGAAYRVVGFFYKPTKFCECGPLPETKARREVYLNHKYGLRVHRPCKRPRKSVGNSPRNMLDPINEPAVQRTAFLHIMGDWRGPTRTAELLENYPISVAHNAGRDTKKIRKALAEATTKEVTK